jgi:muramoyltetrapeptide carboxypeptidase
MSLVFLSSDVVFWPAALKKGDKVALIAPSSPINPIELLDFAVSYIKGLGLEPVLGKSPLEPIPPGSYGGYLAGSDDIRAADVNWAFGDKEIKGIFCLRGGYGAQRILDKICFNNIRQNPKFFSGFSDVTALHTAINHACGS